MIWQQHFCGKVNKSEKSISQIIIIYCVYNNGEHLYSAFPHIRAENAMVGLLVT